MHARTGIAGPTRSARRIFIGLIAAVSTVLSLTSLPAHAADSADRGLFGSQDPTYDGVYRQSYALMGLAAAKVAAPPSAIRWLVDQQCADGSFVAYRIDTSTPCPKADPESYTGPDTNSTALAVLALGQQGRAQEARRAAAWLLRIQLPGGGWGYVEGSAADSTSTALALAALESTPGTGRAQRNALRWLERQIAPCTAPAGERFGIRYQPGALPDGISTSQGLLALAKAFPVRRHTQRQAMPQANCNAQGKPANPTAAVTRWVSTTILAHDGHIPDPFTPGQADWNSTALGIVGLVATRTSGRATASALAALRTNAESYVNDGTADRPAALGTLLFVTTTTGTNPRRFGGIDLPTRLLATVRK
jgi:hypothetical protein